MLYSLILFSSVLKSREHLKAIVPFFHFSICNAWDSYIVPTSFPTHVISVNHNRNWTRCNYGKAIDISARGRIHVRSVITDNFSWLALFLFLSQEDNWRPVYYPCESLSWPVTLLSHRTTTSTMVSSVPSSICLDPLFMRDHLSLLQKPNAASVRLPARHAGNLVTASSCRTSRPSRLTGARTWRWVHFSLKAFPIPLDLSILRLFRSHPCAHATVS